MTANVSSLTSAFPCACGETLHWTPGIGPGIQCRCGRIYSRPTFDLERLAMRIDELEHEVRELRAFRERVEGRT